MGAPQVTDTGRFDVLIVGCGNIAGGFDAQRSAGEPPLTHAGAFSRHAGFALAACVEPDAQRRQAFMSRWQVPLGFESLAQAQGAGPHFDVVSVCSPTPAHAADLESALGLRPRAVFCEKPVTPSVAETERLVRECDQAGVLLAVNHTRRWAPDVVRLQQQLQAGDWGELRSINAVYNKGLLNNGGHLIDLVWFLAGPVSVVAAGQAVHDFWPDDPTVSALLRTESGVPVAIGTADARDYSLFELQLVTSRGTVVMENGGMNWRVRKTVESPHFKGYRTLGAGADIAGEYPLAMTAAVANLHGALRQDAPLASTGHTALQAQRVCEQIRAATRSPIES
jgi:predicted dehydrogenase